MSIKFLHSINLFLILTLVACGNVQFFESESEENLGFSETKGADGVADLEGIPDPAAEPAASDAQEPDWSDGGEGDQEDGDGDQQADGSDDGQTDGGDEDQEHETCEDDHEEPEHVEDCDCPDQPDDHDADKDPELTLYINGSSEDTYSVDFGSDITISYFYMNLMDCSLSFDDTALDDQGNPQLRKAEVSGTYKVTCYDANGMPYSDSVLLTFNSIDQMINGSETVIAKPTDVVLLVDTSGSMNQGGKGKGKGKSKAYSSQSEVERLEETLPKFIEDLNAAFPDDSFQIFVLAESSKIEINPNIPAQRFHKIDQEVKSHDSLEVFQEFSEECSNGNPNNRYANCIRGDSQKEIVVVTDDESKDVSVSEFLNFVDNNQYLAGKTALNGFVGTVKEDKDWCTIKNVGQTYIDLAAEANTAGLVQHLCDEDYAKLLDNLKESIIEKNLQSEFELDYCIDPNESISVSINQDAPLSPEMYSIIDGKKIILVEGVGSADTVYVTYTPTLCPL
ncbi:MAG: hypothetical protein HRU09_17525 [Oligoflexales bacterium]|nr:hypothetical protein [Oligoflexales bacterium]